MILVRLALEAAAWGAMMMASALLALLLERGRALDARTGQILAIYFTGAFIAFGVARPVLAVANRRLSMPWRFLLAVTVLAGTTLAATAGILALDYRIYYAEWHDSLFSVTWFYQQAYTVLGSTYQYLVIGTRLYWPLGPVLLVITSWWLARRAS
ncbi:MAG: hypothetical protein Kow0026_04480 [Oricola sp.]